VNIPDGLRYTRQHEWVLIDGESARIGITDLAQDALGNIVHVQLPTVGQSVQSGASVVEVESSKSVSDIYSPVSGSVVVSKDAVTLSSGVTVDYTTGRVTISPAPTTEVIRGGCYFDIPCRFNSQIEVSAISADLRDCGGIDLIELLNP